MVGAEVVLVAHADHHEFSELDARSARRRAGSRPIVVTEKDAVKLERFAEALGDKAGIRRYGAATLPMDEARVTCALDLSGRPYFVWEMSLPKAKVGDFDSELAEVFFEGFARSSQCNLHMHQHAGENLHHVIEISFKAFARALREATEIDPRVHGIPSTKGTLAE